MITGSVGDGCRCREAFSGFLGLVVGGGAWGVPLWLRAWKAEPSSWGLRHYLSRGSQGQCSGGQRFCGVGVVDTERLLPGLWGLTGWT